MADALRDSLFAGERVINFISAILTERQRPTPITNFEKKLLLREDTIKELNGDLDGKLVELLRNAREYIVPPTAIRILLYFRGLGRVNDGRRILSFITKDRMTLSEEEVTELVEELTADPDASIELWLAVLAREPEPNEQAARNVLNLPFDFR